MTTPEQLIQKFNITPRDLELMRGAGAMVVPELSDFVEQWYGWLGKQSEMTTFFEDTKSIERVKSLQAAHWRGFFEGVVDENYVAQRRGSRSSVAQPTVRCHRTSSLPFCL